MTRTLLLLRHAQAEDFRPGRPDADRRLTPAGRDQAERVGAWMRETGLRPDFVLCSPATRTRQTLEGLGLEAEVDFAAGVYNAGSDTLLLAAQEAPEDAQTVLIVSHAPGTPALAHDLADDESDAGAVAVIESRFPPATLARLEFDGAWADLTAARLVGARLG